MTAIASLRESDFRVKCVQCGEEQIAPARTEYVSPEESHNLWCCSNCGYVFETLDHLNAEATLPIKLIEAFLPNLLVA